MSTISLPENGWLKVVYVGKFSHHYSTENYVTEALESLGVRVSKISYDTSYLHINRLLGSHDMLLMGKAGRPDLKKCLRKCRELSIPSVCWQWDLYLGYRGHKAIPPHFNADYLFTTDGGHSDRFKELGYNHHVLRQGIHEPEAYISTADELKHDVGFVGTVTNHPRRKLINWLMANHKDLSWPRNIRGHRLNSWLTTTRIVVGDSYPSSHYWSNRIYEILGRGGFLLHPHVDGLEEEFIDGVHYVGYARDDWDDLQYKINYYLENDEQRERIRQQGHHHVKNHMTYRHRCASLLSTVFDHVTSAGGKVFTTCDELADTER